jgi:signal transduction histidine kinase
LQAKEDFTELDSHIRMLLFQTIRELLFNVVKHAGVTEAKVTLERAQGHPRITVSDDGKGFDTAQVLGNPQLAHGLLIIQDRLNLLGCQMDLASTPGKGTQIVIELPPERKAN